MQIQDDMTILPGMTAEVKAVVKQQKKKRVFIPYNSVFTDNSKKSFVWAINDENRVYKQEIKLKELSGDSVEVINGIDGVSRIVTSGLRFLQSNDEVKEYEKIGQ